MEEKYTDGAAAEQFMKEAERFALLTKEEELELSARAKQGDKEAKELLHQYIS